MALHPSINLTNIRGLARLAQEAGSKRNHALAANLYRQAAQEAADLRWASIAREYADLARFASNRAMGDSPHA